MNCMIVDDDGVIRIDLEHKLSQIPSLKLEASCASAIQASAILLEKKIDLVFLDVNMPEMNGIQFMKSLNEERPQVILITSEREHALDAFEYNATDFLLKPISDERFFKAISKAQKIFQAKSSNFTISNDFIFIKVNSKLIKINFRDISYIEALADYVVVHVNDNKHIVHSTMKSIESALPANEFARVHNSFIVRLDKISVIEDSTAIIGKVLIPISRAKVKTLMDKLKTL